MTSFYDTGHTVYASDSTSGIVMTESNVEAATTLTESSVSLLNFAENIVVVAAVGAAQAITKAMTILLLSPNGAIAKIARTGTTMSLSTIDM